MPFLSFWCRGFLGLDVCSVVFCGWFCYCLGMFLFNRKFKSLEEKVERLEGRLCGTNDDLRALEDNVCLSRDWDRFVGFVLGEARFSDRWDAFVIPLGRRFMWGSIDKDLHSCVSVGCLKEKVVGRGYDFSKLVLRGTGDVESLVEQLNFRGSLGMFVDDDLLKVKE